MRSLFFLALIGSVSANEITYIDLAHEKHRQVIVDREKGQYLGHPTTALLDDLAITAHFSTMMDASLAQNPGVPTRCALPSTAHFPPTEA